MQHPRRYGLRRCAAMRMSCTAAMVVAAAIVAAGCSSFGRSKSAPVRASDPNAYPANYRNQIRLANGFDQRAAFEIRFQTQNFSEGLVGKNNSFFRVDYRDAFSICIAWIGEHNLFGIERLALVVLFAEYLERLPQVWAICPGNRSAAGRW